MDAPTIARDKAELVCVVVVVVVSGETCVTKSIFTLEMYSLFKTVPSIMLCAFSFARLVQCVHLLGAVGLCASRSAPKRWAPNALTVHAVFIGRGCGWGCSWAKNYKTLLLCVFLKPPFFNTLSPSLSNYGCTPQCAVRRPRSLLCSRKVWHCACAQQSHKPPSLPLQIADSSLTNTKLQHSIASHGIIFRKL
eukprot:6491527-Amphidinium_carterae.2